ncbi:MAG: hypothetical protein PHQ23_16480 [Candidatus Wallbacteria bacterium]|nr:hypothetical protein [Candidatus Wallbacteria bacterium]
MKKTSCLLLISCCLKIYAAVGMVDIRAAFYYHPYVLLYYYPEYQAFMHPVKGRLTKATVFATREDMTKKKAKAAAEMPAKEKPFQDKLNSIKQERASIQQKILEIKNLAWEKQAKQITGKSPEELRQMNVSFSQELNKSLSPHEKRLSDMDREEASAIKQLDRLIE